MNGKRISRGESDFYKIVRVDWRDSSCLPHWTPIRDLGSPSGATCVTVGFLVKESKTAVAVAQSLSESARADCIMEIPRSAIIKMRPRGAKR